MKENPTQNFGNLSPKVGDTVIISLNSNDRNFGILNGKQTTITSISGMWDEKRDFVIDGIGYSYHMSNFKNAPDPFTFTPGVPTEDGWYVVKVNDVWGNPLYSTTKIDSTTKVKKWIESDDDLSSIISHAKLPEL